MDRKTQRLKDLHDMLVGCELGFANDMLRNTPGASRLKVRVMRLDGHDCFFTTEFNPDRINVSMERGVIKSIISIG